MVAENGNNLTLSWRGVNLRLKTVVKDSSFGGLIPWRRPEEVTRVILDDLNGYAKSGDLLAVMGPSGSGKTTLLAAISKRISNGIEGDILLNGKPAAKDAMLRISGFVPQIDLAVETLTVAEHLQFMATLKMDKRISSKYKKQHADDLIRDLGLYSCRNTLLQDVSGGERKRLSLAVQMIGNLPILFCDEPTTGLDSYSANTIATILKRLASEGKLIICSIHQPSSDVFVMFNRLYLLTPGGHLSYHGDRDDAKPYFESIGFQFPQSYNPADYLLQILNPPSPMKLQDQITAFNNSQENSKLIKEIDSVSCKNHDDYTDLLNGIDKNFYKFHSVKKVTQITQLQLLTWRTAISMYRNMQKILVRSFLYIFTGLMISSPYIGLQLNQEGIQNIQGFHYIIVTETIFCHAYGILHTFPPEIPILLREMGNGIYKPGPYYFSKVLIILLRAVVETCLFCFVIFLVAQVGGGITGFMIFTAPVIASAVTSTAYGCFLSTWFENVANASMLSVPVDLVSYTFCGIFLQLSTVPVYLKWVKYVSRFYYGIEALSILQWQNVEDIPCSEKEHIPCIRTGHGVLERYGFNENNLSLDFLAMFIGFCILHLCGFLMLWRRSKQQSVY